MKIFIFAICILLATLCIVSLHAICINKIFISIDEQLSFLPKDTDYILQMSEQEKTKHMAQIAKAEGIWKKNYLYIALTLPIKNIEEFEDELLQMRVNFYEEEYAHYLSNLTLARLKLQTLKFFERVTLENIL